MFAKKAPFQYLIMIPVLYFRVTVIDPGSYEHKSL